MAAGSICEAALRVPNVFWGRSHGGAVSRQAVRHSAHSWELPEEEPAGSDVDFGDGGPAETAVAGPTGPTVVAPCLKRRILQRKTAPDVFIPPNAVAVLPELLPESRLSRSLGVDVFSVKFGNKTRKPQWLVPLAIQGVAVVQRPCLQAVVGKESGKVYYASKPLSESLAAVCLLQASSSVQEAYSRLPLLLSPSEAQAFPSNLTVTLADDIYHGEDATTDGASDIGWRDAVRLNVLKESSGTEYVLYSPVQFRGFFRLRQDLHALGKGMLMVDPTREDGLRLRRSCKKLEIVNAETTSETLGLDITDDTWEAMQPARVNCQVTAALAMRALSGRSAGAREAAMALLETMHLVGLSIYVSKRMCI